MPEVGLLHQLGVRHGTDKANDLHSFAGWSYLDVYERYLAPLRDDVRCVLEIGVRSGASLRMWEEYFPAAQVWGVDVDERCLAHERGRVHVRIAHQEIPFDMMGIAKCAGGALDLVVDDGSHVNAYTLESLRALWPFVRERRGIYAIEDLGCSYLGKRLASEMRRGRWYPEYLKGGPDPENNRKDIDDELLAHVHAMDHLTGPVRAVHCHPMMMVLEKA